MLKRLNKRIDGSSVMEEWKSRGIYRSFDKWFMCVVISGMLAIFFIVLIVIGARETPGPYEHSTADKWAALAIALPALLVPVWTLWRITTAAVVVQEDGLLLRNTIRNWRFAWNEIDEFVPSTNWGMNRTGRTARLILKNKKQFSVTGITFGGAAWQGIDPQDSSCQLLDELNEIVRQHQSVHLD